MALYNIYAGLDGSFGGATYQYTSEFEDIDEAIDAAYTKAVEIYDSYEGLHGLLTYGNALEEAKNQINEEPDLEGLDFEEFADEIYNEYVESWIDYYVISTEEDSIPKDKLTII